MKRKKANLEASLIGGGVWSGTAVADSFGSTKERPAIFLGPRKLEISTTLK